MTGRPGRGSAVARKVRVTGYRAGLQAGTLETMDDRQRAWERRHRHESDVRYPHAWRVGFEQGVARAAELAAEAATTC